MDIREHDENQYLTPDRKRLALQDTGIAELLAQWLCDMPGHDRLSLQCILSVASALIAEVVNTNPSLGLLLPVAAHMVSDPAAVSS